jgi:hypothetical protein
MPPRRASSVPRVVPLSAAATAVLGAPVEAQAASVLEAPVTHMVGMSVEVDVSAAAMEAERVRLESHAAAVRAWMEATRELGLAEARASAATVASLASDAELKRISGAMAMAAGALSCACERAQSERAACCARGDVTSAEWDSSDSHRRMVLEDMRAYHSDFVSKLQARGEVVRRLTELRLAVESARQAQRVAEARLGGSAWRS